MNTLTVLGSGTSTGVPILGCNCHICQSTNPANKRLRTSVMLATARGKNIVVDTSPDLRTQLLRAQAKRVDAALITHDHADHTHGIDDLRPFCFHQNQSLPVHCSAETGASLRRKFDYIFGPPKRPVIGGGIPRLHLEEFDGPAVAIAGEIFTMFALPHGYVQTTGFKHGGLAYLTDCHSIPQEVAGFLREVQLEWLIIDCVKPEPHDTHMGYQQTRTALEQIQPRRAGLIHMGHEWDHEALAERLIADGFHGAAPLKDGDIIRYS